MISNRTGSDSLIHSRNYGIDALRIVTMLMVVMLHVLNYGGILKTSEFANYWIAWFLRISAYCAVDCYALVSGYVGLYSKYKISNLATLWCRVAFYSISITVICKLVFPDKISNEILVSSFFPVFSKRYWYFTAYTILFLFLPILNEAINRLSKKRIRFFLITIVLFVSVIQPFTYIAWGDVFALQSGFSAWWLMILYLFGAYIRQWGLLQRIRSHRTGVFLSMYFVFVVTTWLSKLIIQVISNKIWGEIRYDELLFSYCSITILGSAVSLFLAFEQIRPCSAFVKIIAFLSPLAFSVYLIHFHPIIRANLLTDRFTWIAELPAWQMIPTILGIVISIYLVCSLIDLIRQYLFTKLKMKDRLMNIELKFKTRF